VRDNLDCERLLAFCRSLWLLFVRL
jgi:hypothetical protein